MENLKPCPFCGNKLIYTSGSYIVHDAYLGNIKEWCVYCYNHQNPQSCNAKVVSRKSQQDAIEAWNKRAGVVDTPCSAWKECWDSIKDKQTN